MNTKHRKKPVALMSATAAGRAKFPLRPAGSSSAAAPNYASGAAAQSPSAGAKGLNLQSLVSAANAWREYYNPLRALTLVRAVSLIEAAQRGMFAELQWLYSKIEGSDATLMALIERRTSALIALDHNFKTLPADKLPPGASATLAEDQAAALRHAYDGLDNLREAIEFLALASFRGFSHLEKIYDEPAKRRNGETASADTPTHRHTDTSSLRIVHLEPVEQWHWVRPRRYGPWLYNAAATQTVLGQPVDAARFIIREAPRPINRVALIAFIRKSLSQKDWDAFIEIFGLPGAVVIGPPGVPQGSETLYQTAAENVAKSASGYLPNGSSVEFSDAPRGASPFREHLRYHEEQLILAGTGGLLTMLAQSGSGTLAGSAHQETFEIIAKAEALKLSEVFQKQFDAETLERHFPGQPRLAYFEIAANQETDVSTIVDHAAKLSQAGYRVQRDALAEKTGYDLELKGPSAGPLSAGPPSPGPVGRGSRRAVTVEPDGPVAPDLDEKGNAS